MAVRDFSAVSLDKTKLSPKINNIPIVFDNKLGGRLDEAYSFLKYFQERDYLTSNGGWWHINPLLTASKELDLTGKFYFEFLNKFAGNKRFDDWIEIMRTNEVFYLVMRLVFMDIVGDKYSLQKTVMESYYKALTERISVLTEGMTKGW